MAGYRSSTTFVGSYLFGGAYVTVTGKEQRAITGLTRADFQVLEDGVEQTIESFSVEGGPITAGFVVGGDPSEFRGIAPALVVCRMTYDQ